jgi:hypothetical protein
MAFNTEVASMKAVDLNGEFQLAELEQRLEMASVSGSMNQEPVYYCCFCIAFCDAI